MVGALLTSSHLLFFFTVSDHLQLILSSLNTAASHVTVAIGTQYTVCTDHSINC